MRAALLALVLLAPTASAAVPFLLAFDDARGDVVSPSLRPIDHASADIVQFESIIDGSRVVQRVTVAERPYGPNDSILVRSWFRNSTDGRFWVVDMEVRGDATTELDRFRPVMRRGDFHNDTRTLADARWHVEGATWVFSFDAAHVADAECFDPGVFTQHIPPRAEGRPQGADQAVDERRRCRTAAEPDTRPPQRATINPSVDERPPPATQFPTQPSPPHVEPERPGTRTPTPALGALALVALLAIVAIARRR